MNINNYFDKIFIINLDDRKDRWELILNQLKENNITNFQRFSAIKPIEIMSDTIDNNNIDNNNINNNHYNKKMYSEFNPKMVQKFGIKYKVGALGCKLSHLEIIKHCQRENLNHILILEDDCLFKENFTNNFLKLVETIQNSSDETIRNYDMLYLGGSFIKKNNNSSPTVENNILKCNRIYTTHAYILNNTDNNIFNTIINDLEKNKYPKEIDVYYSQNIQCNYNVYIVYPILIKQYDSYSNILNRNSNYKKKPGVFS